MGTIEPSPSIERPELRFPHRPRRRIWLVAAVAAVAGALATAVAGQPAGDVPLNAEPVAERSDDEARDDGPADEGASDEPATDVGDEAPDPGPTDPELPPLLGEVDGLLLHATSHEVRVLGFHEASSASFAIAPVGRLVANENTTRFEPVEDRTDGSDYHILSSRGRAHPPTSAVDVVMLEDDPVISPVSGVVADIREYHLYGEHLDHRVEIHPFGAPDVRIVLVHVDGVVVAEGDEVVAGRSVLAATARLFPFASQIDRETEPDRFPHVHLEVQPIDARRPGDPVEE